MKNFFLEILLKFYVSFLKFALIAGIVSVLGLLMLVFSIDLINFFQLEKGIIFQLIYLGEDISNDTVKEITIAFFTTLKNAVPGDELLGNMLGLSDFFETLNFDFFLFVDETINSLKTNVINNQNVSIQSTSLIREFAVISISSFVTVEILKLSKIFFKFGGFGVIVGFLYGAIFWIAASYTVSECILIFIEKIIVGKIFGVNKLTIVYIILIALFLGLEIVFSIYGSKEKLLKSGGKTILNLAISFVKTALTWYFVQAVTVATKNIINFGLEINFSKIYTEIVISMVICFTIFILLTILQGKLQKNPEKEDFENLFIIKLFKKIFKTK